MSEQGARMTTLADIYARYEGVDCIRGCDKGTVHSYIPVYEEVLAPYRHTARRVLEIGLMSGASLRMWEDYFDGPEVEVHGVDLCDQPHGGLADLRPLVRESTHRILFFNAADIAAVEHAYGGMSFDVIVEDASHDLAQQLAIYANLRVHLSPGGIYVIEDIADIDRDRAVLEVIDPLRKVTIFDRRALKNRFDDVLVVIR